MARPSSGAATREVRSSSTQLSVRDEAALTLLVYESLTLSEITSLRWRDVGVLLPRSRGLIEKLRTVESGSRDEDFVFGGEDDIRESLERLWAELRQQGLRARPKVVLPERLQTGV